MTRSIFLFLAVVFIASTSAAQTTRTVPVFEAAGGPPAGFPVGDRVDDAHATIIRNDNGVAVHIETEVPEERVFTVWLFECTTSLELGCAPFGPPSFGDATITGDDDEISLVFGISEGSGIVDSQNPFVAFMLNHGPVIPDLIDQQLTNPMVPPSTAPIQVAKFPPGGGGGDDDDSDSD